MTASTSSSSTSTNSHSKRSLDFPKLPSKDAEEDDEGISTKKAVIYLAIVIVCFAVVYPRMIHPMVKSALGFAENREAEKNQKNELPPNMRSGPMPGGPRPGMHPPPGARAMAGQQAETTASKGGSSMMTVILPVYAVGIVLYLIYTATKVYGGGKSGKRKKKRDAHDEIYALITERLSKIDLEKVLAGEDVDGANEINKLAEFLRERNRDDKVSEGEKEYCEQEVIQAKKNKKYEHAQGVSSKDDSTKDGAGIDDLMRKCENQEQMTPEEMAQLQKRLLEMEGRMNKMMATLSMVHAKTTEVADDISEKSTTVDMTSTNTTAAEHKDSPTTLHQTAVEEEYSQNDHDSNSSVHESEVEEIYDLVESSDDDDDVVDVDDLDDGDDDYDGFGDNADFGESDNDDPHVSLRKRVITGSEDLNC